MAGKVSAGILLYRFNGPRKSDGLELFLVHPGGPFFKKKDKGAWSIPKGLIGEGEDRLRAACRELEEETGLTLDVSEDAFIELGRIKQKGGKTVHAFAVEGDLPEDFALSSNTFSMEWPPKSGNQQQFPEVDRAEFFSIDTAKEKINPAQREFLDGLVRYLENNR